jgi:hypothetical protein
MRKHWILIQYKILEALSTSQRGQESAYDFIVAESYELQVFQVQ